jgi:hypothetical protein
LIEFAELLNRKCGLNLGPFNLILHSEEGLIRYALTLLAKQVEELEGGSQETLASVAEEVQGHLELRRSRSQREKAAREAEATRQAVAATARRAEETRRREAAEAAVRAEEEAERERRIGEKLEFLT